MRMALIDVVMVMYCSICESSVCWGMKDFFFPSVLLSLLSFLLAVMTCKNAFQRTVVFWSERSSYFKSNIRCSFVAQMDKNNFVIVILSHKKHRNRDLMNVMDCKCNRGHFMSLRRATC